MAGDLEAGFYRNEALGVGHAGGLARFVSRFGELTVSAGLSGDYDSPDTRYGTVTMLKRF